MRCGDAFLIPAPGFGPTPHLRIVTTEPGSKTGKPGKTAENRGETGTASVSARCRASISIKSK